jgi:hypothetical protein
MRPNKYIRNKEYSKHLEKRQKSLNGSRQLIVYITKEPDPRYTRECACFRVPAIYINTPDRFEEHVLSMIEPYDDGNHYYFYQPEIKYGIKKLYNTSGRSTRKQLRERSITKRLRREKRFEELPLNNSMYKKLRASYRYY